MQQTIDRHAVLECRRYGPDESRRRTDCRWLREVSHAGYVETYNYDAVGNFTGKTDRKNQSITYTYDQLNRLTQKSYPDTSTVNQTYNHTYDLDSRLTK